MNSLNSTLPPLDTTPVVLLRFTSKASEILIKDVKIRLSREGIVIFEEKDTNGNVIFGLTVQQSALEKEADRCNLIMPVLLTGSVLSDDLKGFEGKTVMRPFDLANREHFIVGPTVTNKGTESCVAASSSASASASASASRDNEGLFTSADRVKMIFSEIEALPVLKPGLTFSESALVQELERTIHIAAENENEKDRNKHLTIEYRNMYLCDTLRNHGFVDVFAPVHNRPIAEQIYHEAMDPRTPFPIDGIRSYYGEEIAFYFTWLQHYTRFLLFPGISGLVIFILRTKYFQETVDTCRLTPFHGIITFLWAVSMIQFWSREENRKAYQWGTSSRQGFGDRDIFTNRHDFKGTWRKSEVTGQLEKYYPANVRRMKCALSGVVTLILLTGAFWVMILSLNAQGLIKPKTVTVMPNNDANANANASTLEMDHPFHFPVFASLAGEGAMFDANSSVCCFIPVIIHVVLIMVMNLNYRTIAEKLTDWENHATHKSYSDSMIIKRFCFEATDCYLVLFFLAFYEQDIIKVRSELVSVFSIDTFRRLALEGLVPYIQQKIALRKKKHSAGASKKRDGSKSQSTPVNITMLQENAEKDEYEQFDDYMEMIIQIGYITLFASAYPLAGLLAIAANVVEMRLDLFKLTYLSMRPRSVPTGNIGTWNMLIKAIVWMSAITNCLIFTFSSMQMAQFLPEYFTVDSEGEHDLKKGTGWMVIFIIFGIERALLVAGVLISLFIPTVPEDVIVREKRKRYIDFRMHQDAKAKNRKKDD